MAGAAALATSLPAADAARTVATRRIPGTDENLSVVALGNSEVFRQRDHAGSRALLKTYFDHGGRYVDAGGEAALHVASTARSLERGRDLFLGAYFRGASPDESAGAAAQLRATMGKPSLDLMHTTPEDGVPNWNVFRKWKEEGLTRYIGLARHNVRYYDMMMEVMATGTLDFLQVNLSPLETDAEARILPMAMDKGVAVTINRPFLNGEYFSVVKGRELPAWAVEFDCTSWAQFSIKYVLSHPAVTCVLTETANPKHILDNLGGGIGPLPDQSTRKKMRELIQSFS